MLCFQEEFMRNDVTDDENTDTVTLLSSSLPTLHPPPHLSVSVFLCLLSLHSGDFVVLIERPTTWQTDHVICQIYDKSVMWYSGHVTLFHHWKSPAWFVVNVVFWFVLKPSLNLYLWHIFNTNISTVPKQHQSISFSSSFLWPFVSISFETCNTFTTIYFSFLLMLPFMYLFWVFLQPISSRALFSMFACERILFGLLLHCVWKTNNCLFFHVVCFTNH